MISWSVLAIYRSRPGLFTFVNRFSECQCLCWDFITVSELSVSEHVGTPARMIHVLTVQFKNSTPLTVHTPETVTSLTPRRALTKIHLLCRVRVSKVRKELLFFLFFFFLTAPRPVTSNRLRPSSRMFGAVRADSSQKGAANNNSFIAAASLQTESC